MTKTTLYLTRHGETEWNAQGRIMGHLDSPLTDRGVQQAIWLRDALKDQPFAAIYASSSQRTRTTAEILRDTRELPIIADDRLREIYLGNWEGLMSQEIKQKYPEEFSLYRHAPELYQASNGGETFLQLQQRIMPCINELISQHEGQEILIVTHAITLKTVLTAFEQRPIKYVRQPPLVLWASLSKVVVENGIATIELYADTSHYKTSSSPTVQAKNVQDG
jgi:broad specificity phosphatase PhoE